MLKDFRDEHGDALYGKRTFLVRFGRRRTCLSAAALWVAGAAVILAGQGSWTLTLLWVPFGLVAVWFITSVSRDQWGTNDVYHIAIAAVAGRATVVMLLADLGVRPLGMPWLWWAVQLPVVAMTAPVIYRFAQLAARNPAQAVGRLPSAPPVIPTAWAPTSTLGGPLAAKS